MKHDGILKHKVHTTYLYSIHKNGFNILLKKHLNPSHRERLPKTIYGNLLVDKSKGGDKTGVFYVLFLSWLLSWCTWRIFNTTDYGHKHNNFYSLYITNDDVITSTKKELQLEHYTQNKSKFSVSLKPPDASR